MHPGPTRPHAGPAPGAMASVIAAALLWATMGIFVRTLDRYGISSMEVVALRAAITAAILVALTAARQPGALRIRWRDTWCFVGTGICSIVFFNFCYFRTITLTSLSVAAVLLYTAPALVMVLSVALFGERATQLKLAALALAFAGCVLATGAGAGGDGVRLSPAGVLTGLGAGLGYALYSIFGRYALQRGYGPLTIATYTFAFATVGVTLLVDAPGLARAVATQPALAAWSVAMAVCTTVLPYLLYTAGLRHLETSQASIIASVEPVGATLIGALGYGEALTPRGIAGVGLVIVSILLLRRRGERDRRAA